eukprot:4715954-Pleurochrysis_carterae.AAC.1
MRAARLVVALGGGRRAAARRRRQQFVNLRGRAHRDAAQAGHRHRAACASREKAQRARNGGSGGMRTRKRAT